MILEEQMREKNSERINPYGLTKKSIKRDEYKTTTAFDPFLLEDTLRLVRCGDRLPLVREKLDSRYNESTGLYEVTVGDVHTEYYAYATMFNRLSNPDYSIKVHQNAELFKSAIKTISEQINTPYSDFQYDTTERKI